MTKKAVEIDEKDNENTIKVIKIREVFETESANADTKVDKIKPEGFVNTKIRLFEKGVVVKKEPEKIVEKKKNMEGLWKEVLARQEKSPRGNKRKFFSQELVKKTTAAKELNEGRGEKSGDGFSFRNVEGFKKKNLRGQKLSSTCKQGSSETGGGGWKEEIKMLTWSQPQYEKTIIESDKISSSAQIKSSLTRNQFESSERLEIIRIKDRKEKLRQNEQVDTVKHNQQLVQH